MLMMMTMMMMMMMMMVMMIMLMEKAWEPELKSVNSRFHAHNMSLLKLRGGREITSSRLGSAPSEIPCKA
eukprot:10441272-Karenia_brevis.AAC.1